MLLPRLTVSVCPGVTAGSVAVPGGSRIRDRGRRVPVAFWTALLQSHLDTNGRQSRTSTAAVRQGMHSAKLSGLIYTGKMEGIHHKKWLHTFQVQQEHKPARALRTGDPGLPWM